MCQCRPTADETTYTLENASRGAGGQAWQVPHAIEHAITPALHIAPDEAPDLHAAADVEADLYEHARDIGAVPNVAADAVAAADVRADHGAGPRHGRRQRRFIMPPAGAGPPPPRGRVGPRHILARISKGMLLELEGPIKSSQDKVHNNMLVDRRPPQVHEERGVPRLLLRRHLGRPRLVRARIDSPVAEARPVATQV